MPGVGDGTIWSHPFAESARIPSENDVAYVCNVVCGFGVPMPNLPELSIRIFSTLLLTKTVGNAAVDPMYKLFVVYKYAFVASVDKYNGIEDAAEPAIVSLKPVAAVPIPTLPPTSL